MSIYLELNFRSIVFKKFVSLQLFISVFGKFVVVLNFVQGFKTLEDALSCYAMLFVVQEPEFLFKSHFKMLL